MSVFAILFVFTTACSVDKISDEISGGIINEDISGDYPEEDSGDNGSDDGNTTLNDTDNDGIADENDNCVYYFNTNQADNDDDGEGDLCDVDDDNDDVLDINDDCPTDATGTQDSDLDGICDENDNCPEDGNDDQTDTDNDGIGDICDEDNDDADGDMILDEDDNCPTVANEDQINSDTDSFGDACDNCDSIDNEDQSDLDEDDAGDVCEDTEGDNDVDGDGDKANTDCDDYDPNAFSGNIESFDFIDNDCDGFADTDLALVDMSTYFDGSADYSFFGFATAGNADVNGDGYDDLLVSSFGDDNSTGKVYLFLGNDTITSDVSADLADVTFIGENEGDSAGISVALIQDLNSDGYDEILIGAFGNDDAGDNAGKVYLVYGQEFSAGTTINLSSANVTFTGINAHDYLGNHVASAGDVDGDKKGDFLLSAFGFDSYITGSEAGKVYLFYGSGVTDTSTLSDANETFIGENATDTAGIKAGTVGDFNGDGTDDFYISAAFNDDTATNAGKIYIFFGEKISKLNNANTLPGHFATRLPTNLSTANIIFTGESNADFAGLVVTGGVDINNDGKDDLVVGIMSSDDAATDAGKTYIIYGDTSRSGTFSLSTADLFYTGENSSDYSGAAAAIINDLDGDGYAEIFIGAYSYDYNVTNDGKIYCISGQDKPVTPATYSLDTATATFVGSSTNENTGSRIINAGDLDGNGSDDIVVSAFGYDGDTGTSVGRVYILSID